MATTAPLRNRIQALKKEFDHLRKSKKSLLVILDEAEIPESVYNSNAIENSTLTLKETEKILLEMEVSRDVSVREIFEAKNLARVMEYIRNNINKQELNKEILLFLHQMLINGINDKIAGRLRQKNEYVRVGTHIAPPPERIEKMLENILENYFNNLDIFLIDKIAKFHLDFETIHPFIDGNGRIGRVIANYQLQQFGFPTIIIRDKEKKDYYRAFDEYRYSKNTKPMEKFFALALIESLHKRITYLHGQTIITLSEYAKQQNKTPASIGNAASRQNIPAFRERGVWKIGINDE
jgi:Fic family protein